MPNGQDSPKRYPRPHAAHLARSDVSARSGVSGMTRFEGCDSGIGSGKAAESVFGEFPTGDDLQAHLFGCGAAGYVARIE